MRIATWNVNSLNARLPRVEEWLDYARPDVLCMQETKLADGAFPTMAFSALGYESASHGDGRWNGVAVREPGGPRGRGAGLRRPRRRPGRPPAGGHMRGGAGAQRVRAQRPGGRQRALRGQVGVVRRAAGATWSAPSSPPTTWRCAVTSTWLPRTATSGTRPRSWARPTSPAPERDKLAGPRGLGPRRLVPPGARRGRALHLVGLPGRELPQAQGPAHRPRLAEPPPWRTRVTYALVDRNARKGKLPSDHAPVLIDID